METSLFCATPILIILVIAVYFILLYGLLMFIFTRSSHLNKLTELYATTIDPHSPAPAFVVQIGPVRFRRCVTVSLEPAGFYLWVRPAFTRYQPLLIPWSQLKGIKETYVYWRKAMQLSIGEPRVATITVLMDLYEQMRPYLHT